MGFGNYAIIKTSYLKHQYQSKYRLEKQKFIAFRYPWPQIKINSHIMAVTVFTFLQDLLHAINGQRTYS